MTVVFQFGLPMIRRLFTILAAISLLLCLATAVLWVMNYSRCSRIAWGPFHRAADPNAKSVWGLFMDEGKWVWVRLDFSSEGFLSEGGFASNLPEATLLTLEQEAGPLSVCDSNGFRIQHGLLRGVIPYRVVAAPGWSIVAATAALPAAWAFGFARRFRSRTRARGGRCLKCGYDLRGTPRRCPECGAPDRVQSTIRSDSPCANC